MAVRDRTRRGGLPSGSPHGSAPGLTGRLGLSVPYGWWPSPSLLKSYEAAGFAWVQLHAPPAGVLAEPRLAIAHAREAARSLGATGLRAVLHAPATLRAGDRENDRVFEGMLSYAAESGAEQVVYHALALPDDPASEGPLEREADSLARMAALAERLEVKIAVENLAPFYPGPETLSASPLTLRGLVKRIGSPAVSICLDVGHAHIVGDGRHTAVERLCQPVLGHVSVFHLHDNLGARRGGGEHPGVDPLRLDLHLPPGRGTVPWQRLAPLLAAGEAPLVLEAHPPYRGRSADLAAAAGAVLRPRRRS